ncbi:MAG: MFS transporter, partial [Anaerolineales bacterium]|nr:MFS transporter [Anaerolineales bacterium]
MKRLTPFIFTLLLIEFLDEFVFGAREAAWPLVRDDLNLTYTQIGMLLSLPGVIASFIEPVIGILGDVWKRRVLVLGGGVFFAGSLLLTAISRDFGVLLLSFIIFYPSSGAFVSLSQAALMDEDPTRHEQNMARWTFAGSLGVVAGPLALGAAMIMGYGWRALYAVFGILSLLAVAYAARFRFSKPSPIPTNSEKFPLDEDDAPPLPFREDLRAAFQAA